jgi:uncharacterized membrane protein YecN with MAPEG domain
MYWTSFYASILCFVYFYLAAAVIRLRIIHNISIGDGNNKDLKILIRRHANFIEYVPICLLLIMLSESNGAGFWLVHLAGSSLLLGRILHLFCLSKSVVKDNVRMIAMLLTFLSLFTGAISNLYIVVLGHF